MILMSQSFLFTQEILVLRESKSMICFVMSMIFRLSLGDIGNILAIISIGDRIQDIERLVGALADIKRL